MDRMPLTKIIDEIEHLLVKTFSPNDLKHLLRSKMEVNLDDIAPNATGNIDLVFEVLLWMDRRGFVNDLVEIAAADRPKILEWQNLLAKVRGGADPTTNIVKRTDEIITLPPISAERSEITALVRGYLRLRRVLPDGDQKTVQLQALVSQLLSLSLENYNLADEFHLDECGGRRLVAVLTLVRRPEQRYLHWLAERLCVENSFVGYQAAFALKVAAKALTPINLDSMMDAIEKAVEFASKRKGNKGRLRVLADATRIVRQRAVSE